MVGGAHVVEHALQQAPQRLGLDRDRGRGGLGRRGPLRHDGGAHRVHDPQLEDLGRARMFLGLTVLGGALFLGMQVYEWTHNIHRGLLVFGNPWGATLFGTSFYVITGFHGLHVTGGVIYLSVVLALLARIQGFGRRFMITEIAGLYWHFVDLVWIMVFTFVYLL